MTPNPPLDPRSSEDDEPPARPTLRPNQRVAIDDAPETWVEAERTSPTSAPERRGRPRRGRVTVIPVQREGTFVANAVAAAAGFVGASLWYGLDLVGAYDGRWAPVGVALLIAVSVRLFSRAHPHHRTVVSTVAYLLVLLIVLMLLTHRGLVEVYGEIDDYRTYEESLVRSRLQDPFHLLGYAIGGLLAALVPLVPDRR